MNDTPAVQETRRWRAEVDEQTRNLTPDELRAREDELLRQAKRAGVEFEAIVDAPPKPAAT